MMRRYMGEQVEDVKSGTLEEKGCKYMFLDH